MTTNNTPTPYLTLEASIEAARESARIIAQGINSNESLSDAGKDENYHKHTAEHRAHFDTLTAQVTEIVDEAERAVDQLKATLMPAPANDTAAVAAELQAARILARPGMDEEHVAIDWMSKSTASPARTVVLNELVERGLIKADVLDRLLAETHPEYAAAHTEWSNARTAGQILLQRLEEFKAQLDNRRAPAPDKKIPRVGVNVISGLPDTKVKVTPWKATQAENVYRQNL